MGAYKGTVTRPSNGQKVAWILAPGLGILGHQLDKLGIVWYSIGNADHLKLHGGHTPWKPGAPAGMVTAIDVMKTPDSLVEKAILALMRSENYDTSWIDFINTNGHQYDWNGRFQASSGDLHLHLECLGVRTSFNSNLFYDMFGWPVGVVKPSVIKPSDTPASTVTLRKDDNMITLVKLRTRDDVWAAEDGELQHLSPAQFKSAQAFNKSRLPSTASVADKTVVATPFVVENEEELALYGRKIVPLTSTVEGL